jgi:hypothetical protein
MTERYDMLLRFLSEKAQGTWSELKDAFDWIWGPTEDPAEKAWIAARDLAALGHIEIAWAEEGRWCAAPPLLTMLPRSGGRAFVTGARTGFLAERLETAAEERGLWIDRCGRQRGPTTLLVACEKHQDAVGLAADLGIEYTYSVAEQLSMLLPGLDRYMAMFPEGSELPAGFEAERFDPAGLEWGPVTSTGERGLYRTRTFHGQVFALLDATSRWRRVVREFAAYEVLRWEEHSVLSYWASRAQLRVPVTVPLPPLHARAVSICDGRLPRFEHRDGRNVLVYENVPLEVAERIASSLDQVMVEDDGNA